MRNIFYFLIVLCFLISACSPPAVQADNPNPTNTPIKSTLKPTVTLTSSPTMAPSQTITSTRIVTTTPTTIPTSTSTPTNIPTFEPGSYRLFNAIYGGNVRLNFIAHGPTYESWNKVTFGTFSRNDYTLRYENGNLYLNDACISISEKSLIKIYLDPENDSKGYEAIKYIPILNRLVVYDTTEFTDGSTSNASIMFIFDFDKNKNELRPRSNNTNIYYDGSDPVWCMKIPEGDRSIFVNPGYSDPNEPWEYHWTDECPVIKPCE